MNNFFKQQDICWLNKNIKPRSWGSNPKYYEILKFLIKEQPDILPNNPILKNIEFKKNITNLLIKLFYTGDWACSNLLLNSTFSKLIDFSNSDLKIFAFIHLEKILKPRKNSNTLDQLTKRNITKFIRHILMILEKFNFQTKEINKLKDIFLRRMLFEQKNIEVCHKLQQFYNELYDKK